MQIQISPFYCVACVHQSHPKPNPTITITNLAQLNTIGPTPFLYPFDPWSFNLIETHNQKPNNSKYPNLMAQLPYFDPSSTLTLGTTSNLALYPYHGSNPSPLKTLDLALPCHTSCTHQASLTPHAHLCISTLPSTQNLA